MKAFFKKIKNNIWAYLLCIFVVIIMWSGVFSFLTVVDEEEKVSVFIGSYSQSFTRTSELEESRPDYIKKVEVTARVLNSLYFDVYLSMFGYSNADILILPESLATAENCELYFAEISPEYVEELDNLGVFEYNDKVYGLKVHSKGIDDGLITCIDYSAGDEDENYYMFFRNNSLHIGEMSEEDGETDVAAIEIAKKLLEL